MNALKTTQVHFFGSKTCLYVCAMQFSDHQKSEFIYFSGALGMFIVFFPCITIKYIFAGKMCET